MGFPNALIAIERRAAADLPRARERWSASLEGAGSIEGWTQRFWTAGRLTLNVHPDRVDQNGRTVAAGLAADGEYRSQWITGISAGSRSAVPGGERQRCERELFDGAYDDVEPLSGQHPVYGSLDLLFDEHGGSPRFGSSYLVLASHVRQRTTFCLGDSHQAPRDVGTFDQPWGVLAGLAEQAQRGRLLNRGLGTDVLRAVLNGEYRPARASRDLDGYVEIQIHGGVSLVDDVEAVIVDPSFRGTDVEQNLASAGERFGFELGWHCGSVLNIEQVPSDFRGPTMPALARQVADTEGIVHARAIGLAAAHLTFEHQRPGGDDADSALQRLKYLWHTVLAHGHDYEPAR